MKIAYELPAYVFSILDFYQSTGDIRDREREGFEYSLTSAAGRHAFAYFTSRREG